MKLLLTASLFLASSLAYANPFNGFIGEYKVEGKPAIRNENAKWCNRFDFKNITSLKIEANTNGYQQSHLLHIVKPNGWSSHPTMDFDYKNEFNNGGSYARTSGSDSSASNEYGSWAANPNRKDTLTVSIAKSGASYVFNMAEALYENDTLRAACYYQVQLTKK